MYDFNQLKEYLKLTTSIIIDDVFQQWSTYEQRFNMKTQQPSKEDKMIDLRSVATSNHLNKPSIIKSSTDSIGKIIIDDFSSLENPITSRSGITNNSRNGHFNTNPSNSTFEVDNFPNEVT